MNCRTSATTWFDKLFRESNMVSTMPWIERLGLRVERTCSTVCSSCDKPSSAKNSHCSGTRIASEAALAFTGSRLSEAGKIHGRCRDVQARHRGRHHRVAQRRFADQHVISRAAAVAAIDAETGG